MRKETKLDHGLYYVDRSSDEYHKISGDGCEQWSRANDEESRVLAALLREAHQVLKKVAEYRASGEAAVWGEIMETDLLNQPFGLYYISTDGESLYDFFEATETLPALWGAEFIAAQVLVRYARNKFNSYGSGCFPAPVINTQIGLSRWALFP